MTVEPYRGSVSRHWRCEMCGAGQSPHNACCDECGWDGRETTAQREARCEPEQLDLFNDASS
jgi:hypothetical protein